MVYQTALEAVMAAISEAAGTTRRKPAEIVRAA
jgi:hypothetical protein